jgi:hypothetical protein
LYVAHAAFRASSLVAMFKCGGSKTSKGLHKLYFSIICAYGVVGLQVIPALERTTATFLFVLHVWRVVLDAQSLHTIG